MAVRDCTDDLIAFLNSLLEVDRYAIAELLTKLVPCSQELADHPTVQVWAADESLRPTFMRPGTFRVGLLGILNGFCGTIDFGTRAGSGPIGAVYDEGRLVRFQRVDAPGDDGVVQS